MFHLNDETTLIGTGELRSNISQLTKDLKVKTVIVTVRGTPVAVLKDFKKFQEEQNMLETFEDLVLGHIALERDRKAKEKDFISHEEMIKKLKIRKKKRMP